MINLLIKFTSIHKFRIPTLLGLGIILLGIIAGVFLVLQGDQIFFTQASADIKPENIQITNIEDKSVSISWLTQKAVTGFITFSQNTPNGETVGDDANKNPLEARIYHHITLKNLTPATAYQARIISGGLQHPQVLNFTTATTATNQNGLKPIIGSILGNNQPISDGIAYLYISGVATQSSTIKNLGNFIIPLAQVRTQDLSGVFSPTPGMAAKLTIMSSQGQTNVNFIITDNLTLGPLQIGKNLDLTIHNDSVSFDLDNNGIINALDHALAVKQKKDLNGDKIFDKKDSDLILSKINQ